MVHVSQLVGYTDLKNRTGSNIYCWEVPEEYSGVTEKKNENSVIFYLKSNKLVAKILGKRKQEVGLVVPAKFKALTKLY